MVIEDDDGSTPSGDEQSLSPAERFARLLSPPGEEGGAEKPDAGTASAKKPTPDKPLDGDQKATETAGDEGDKTATEKSVDLTSRRRVKVDGEEVEVTLEEALRQLAAEVPEDQLLKDYSFTAHNTRKAQKLAEREKAFEKEQAEAKELTQQYRAVLPKLEAMAQKAVDEFAGVDWDALRREDPAEFAEQRAAYELQRDRLAAVKSEKDAEAAKQQKEEADAFNAYVAAEQESLLRAVPEWKDDTKRDAELKEIAGFAQKELGFTPEDLAHTFDHRVIKGLRLAYLGSKVMAEADGAKKKVAEARKTASPGTRSKEAAPGSERLASARANLRKSGKEKDAADAFAALFDAKKAGEQN